MNINKHPLDLNHGLIKLKYIQTDTGKNIKRNYFGRSNLILSYETIWFSIVHGQLASILLWQEGLGLQNNMVASISQVLLLPFHFYFRQCMVAKSK